MSGEESIQFGDDQEGTDEKDEQINEEEECLDVFLDLPLSCQEEDDDDDWPPSPPPPSQPPKLPRGKIADHVKPVPGEPALYHCLNCNATFNRVQRRYHNLCPEERRPYQCSLCSRKFISKSHLDYHERIHSGETPYKCKYCEKSFRQISKVKRHENTHLGKRALCTICKKLISSGEALKVHMLTHEENRQYSCSVCEKKYSRKANLNRHLVRHAEPQYICDKCGKGFVRKSSLINHIQLHSRKKPFNCSDCQKSFKSKVQLSRHKINHSSGSEYACTKCSVTFKRKDNMDRHMRNLHPGERPSTSKKQSTSVFNDDSLQMTNTHSEVPLLLATPSSVIKHTKSVDQPKAERVSVIMKLP